MTATSRRRRLSGLSLFASVYPHRPIAQAGKLPRCRAERFMKVQVHDTVHLAAAPGA
jgi:hypothetical protein